MKQKIEQVYRSCNERILFTNYLIRHRLLSINQHIMKTLKCDLCDVTAQGKTFEEWMEALMPHYMQAHANVMNDPKKEKEEQQKWMSENKKRFDAA